MKTSELIGPALDWAVAKCEGRENDGTWDENFSSNWLLGGPIIEREKLSVVIQRADAWRACCPRYVFNGYGPTPLIAAMRCYVASNLGDDVNIPEELL